MNKIFENIHGNQFKLINENINRDHELLREGLRKIFEDFASEISYPAVQNMGWGYIKEVGQATRIALREARKLALEYGYSDDEANQKFVKSEETHSETDMSNPEEAQEVQIAKEILNVIDEHLGHDLHPYHAEGVDKIKILAQKLLTIHGSK